jgi:hypothetical protein
MHRSNKENEWWKKKQRKNTNNGSVGAVDDGVSNGSKEGL